MSNTIKLELTEAELALLQEWACRSITEIERKQSKLESSIQIHTQLGDLETIARIKDRLARLEGALEVDTALDLKLYKASKLFS